MYKQFFLQAGQSESFVESRTLRAYFNIGIPKNYQKDYFLVKKNPL